TEPEPTDLVAPLTTEVRMRERGKAASGERTTGVRAIQCLAVEVEDDLDPPCSLLMLRSPRHRVSRVLHQFQKRPVRVAADPDGLLLVGVLRDQVRICAVRVDRPLEELVNLSDQPRVRHPIVILLHHGCTAPLPVPQLTKAKFCTYAVPGRRSPRFRQDVTSRTVDPP